MQLYSSEESLVAARFDQDRRWSMFAASQGHFRTCSWLPALDLEG